MGCGSVSEIVEKVHSQLYCILLGLMWTLCEICVSISEISLFCLKKGLILVHCYKRSLNFALFKRGENWYTFSRKVYFSKKSSLNSAPWRPVLTRGACLSGGILLGLTLGSDSSYSPYIGAYILAPLPVSSYVAAYIA